MSEGNEFGIDGLTDFRPIGSGGFSAVYAAWDAGFQRWVAVKILYDVDEAGRRRFDRERMIMGRLSQHRDVVTPFRFGYTNNQAPYLVMEYVTGGSLADIISTRGHLAWQEAVELLVPVCGALSFAHGEGILHRDIKPDNILLTHGGAKLGDFGIAAIRAATSTSTAFTLAHTPPETFAGGSDQRDERADVYSLVSTLYTTIMGRAPFEVDEVDSQPAYMVRINENEPPPIPAELAPADLRRLIASGLAKDPAHRPQSAQELRQELVRIERRHGIIDGEEPTSTADPHPPPGGTGPEVPPSAAETISADAPVSADPLTSPMAANARGDAPDPDPGSPSAPNGSVGPAGVGGLPSGGARTEGGPGAAVETRSDRSGRRRPLTVALVAAVALAALGGVAVTAASLLGDDGRGPDADEVAADQADADGGEGDGTPTTAPDDGTAGDEAAEPTRPAVGAGEGGPLSLLHWQPPTTLNSYLSASKTNWLASSLVLEPLAEWSPDGELIPALAAEIPTLENGGISGDRTMMTWRLQAGIVWSDGTPLTADDVVFTSEYCTVEGSPCTRDFARIVSVEAVDDLTVLVTFNQPTTSPFVAFVGAKSPILQRAQFETCLGTAAATCDEQNLAPIGTGPYLATSMQPGELATFEANPRYRGIEEGRPFFGTIEIAASADAETAARAVLEQGEADYAWNLQIEPEVLDSFGPDGTGEVLVAFGSLVEQMHLNQTNPAGDPPSDYAGGTNPHPFFFENAELAKALSLAIDREHLATVGYGPLGTPTCNAWHLADQISTNNDWCLTQDLSEAARILNDLGYVDTNGDAVRERPDGTPLEWELVTSVNPVRQRTQELIQGWWAEIGIKLTLRQEEVSELFTPDSEHSAWKFFSDIQMFGNASANPDAREYLAAWATQSIPESTNGWAGNNFARMANPDYDVLANQLAATPRTDPARHDLVIRLNDIIVSESGSLIPLIHRGNASALAIDIEGTGELNPWDSEYYNIEEWYRAEPGSQRTSG